MIRKLQRGLAAACLAASAAPATSPPALPEGWTAEGIAPSGYIQLEGPRTFKLGLREHESRWYLFVAQGIPGRPGGSFTVVDVTDPWIMRPVTTVEVPNASGQLTLHDDLLIVGQQPTPWAPPETGGSVEYPFRGSDVERNELATLFDISDPRAPKRLSAWTTDGWATHRNGYSGGDLAFMSAWIPGYRGQSVLVFLDVSDPAHPREAGRWAMPGQSEKETEIPPPSGYHGPPYLHPDGRTITLGYTPALVNLDIGDPASPKLIGRLDFAPLAAVGTQAIHTAVPIGSGYFVVSTEPSATGCGNESLAFAAIVDNRDLAHPKLVAHLPRPLPAESSEFGSFCEKEGRFGAHNTHTEVHQAAAQPPGDFLYYTWFTAGLRVFDVSDPFMPRETAWFLPAIGPWEDHFRGPEDVIVDRRGNIFISDGRQGGIWSLRLADAGAVGAAVPEEQRAIVQAGNGGPEVLSMQSVPVLEPDQGQVLIRVHAAGVNPVDWKIREGSGTATRIPGFDVAGRVAAVGDGVTAPEVGDAVFGMLGFSTDGGLNGGYAEYAIAPADMVQSKGALTYVEAAGLPIAGITALRLVYVGDVDAGERVFINGIAGGVGSAAAQIAKARGAEVIGTASARHHEYLRSIGVDEVIDYTKVAFEDAVAPVDVYLETVNSDIATRGLAILKKGGRLASAVGLPDADDCDAGGIGCAEVGSETDGPRSESDLLREVGELARAGKLRVNVDRTFPLEAAADAQEYNRAGHTRGKVIIEVLPER
jgi:NADPH:quinone reductase-like Zn-dependent oxidoreductase